ncbi:hypothetical protein AX774_g297, partial [Zancudomyces culisetae]
MLEVQDTEQECLESLYAFYKAQVRFHNESMKALAGLGVVFDGCMRERRAPARERYRGLLKKDVDTDRRATLERVDSTVSRKTSTTADTYFGDSDDEDGRKTTGL